MQIPLFDPMPQFRPLQEALQTAVTRVLQSGRYYLGPEVTAFEQEAAAYLGVKHAVGVNSGTDALVIALRALGVGPGDEVITTPFTFFATVEAIVLVGATPVFADVEPETFNLDPKAAAAAITDRTKAILPVHLFGHAAAMDELLSLAKAHDLQIVEDVAQAFGGSYHGQKLGALGDVGALSFFPTKNLGAYGDGGLLVTSRDDVAEAARLLRMHGAVARDHHVLVGYNSRLDEIHAAMLRVKLPYLEEWNESRRLAAQQYTEALRGVPGVVPPVEQAGVHHVYGQYTVRIEGARRDDVQARLQAAGISSMIYYSVPVHRLEMFRHIAPSLPVAESLATQVLSLPIWPGIETQTVARVLEVLADRAPVSP